MQTRVATESDAERMSQVMREIIAQSGRDRPSDVSFIIAHYIAHPTTVRCTVALDGSGEVVGFQSLKKAASNNRYDLPAGWGIIGTHISPHAHRRGVGRLLFSATLEPAVAAGIEKIDAYIGADSPSALHYYDALGFRSYREPEGIIQKLFAVERPSASIAYELAALDRRDG